MQNWLFGQVVRNLHRLQLFKQFIIIGYIQFVIGYIQFIIGYI
jgi:hypothetical protein